MEAEASCPVAVHFLQRRESNTTKCPNARKGRVPDRLCAARMPLDEARIVRKLVGIRRDAMRVEPNTAPHLKP